MCNLFIMYSMPVAGYGLYLKYQPHRSLAEYKSRHKKGVYAGNECILEKRKFLVKLLGEDQEEIKEKVVNEKNRNL